MRTLVLAVAVALAGCAMMKNTPEQDRVWDAFHACQYEGRIPGNIQLINVRPDGGYTYQWTSSAYGAADVRGCISEKYRELQKPAATR